MSKENTFVKLYRGIEDHWLWDDKPFSKGQAWIDLIMMANAADVKKPYKGEIMTFKRGVVHRSVLSLAEKWGWSRHKVMDFLAVLEKDNMITKNGSPNGTTITIENYSKYQNKPTTKGQQKDNERYNERTTKGQPADTIKNDKNDKNDNKEKIYKKESGFAPPSVEEVRQYCAERQNGVDAEIFVDFYASKGWMIGKNKMKDWKAAVRTWERTQDEKHNGMARHTQPKRTGTDWNALTANG